MPETRQRLLYVDMAKTIALVLVVYSHIPGALCQQYLGSFFIFTFFFLSGFTGRTRLSWDAHQKKRARRLLVPYLVFSLALVFVSGNHDAKDFAGIVYSRYSLYPLDRIPNVVFLRSRNTPLWFLTAMFVADGVYYALVRHIKSYKGLAAAVAVLTALAMAMGHLPVLLPWSLDTMPFFVIAMLMGHAIKGHDELFSDRWSIVLLAFLFVLSCFLNGNINLSCRIYGHSVLLALVSGMTGTLLLLSACKVLENRSRLSVLAILGRHTLTVFSLQMAVIHVCVNTLHTMGLNADSGLWHAVISLFIIVVVFAVGTALSVVLRRLLPSVF